MSLVHSPILESRLLRWPDPAACRQAADRLAARDALRDAGIELRGPLGAGKTTFVRYLLRALGVRGTVKSPTYAVMEPYALPAGGSAWHFDFYRFDDPQEWEDAGFRDVYGAAGLKLAEWPDKAAGLLPLPDLRIDIAFDDAAGRLPAVADEGGEDGEDGEDGAAAPRTARFDALTPRGVELLP